MVKRLHRFELGAAMSAGVVAGVSLAAFEMLATAFLMGTGAAAMPLRMAGAMVLGARALGPGYSLAVAGTMGLIVHMVLSIAFAGVFAIGVSWIPTVTQGELLTTAGEVVLAGIVFGIALWLVNFYVVAPLVGWTWFPEQANHIVAFLGHAFFFGGPLGLVLGRVHVVSRRAA